MTHKCERCERISEIIKQYEEEADAEKRQLAFDRLTAWVRENQNKKIE